ncbi:MAG: regulatory protein RecX [Syntrophaceae bacterium]|nr:regulatory protein RecX [Syntrophaceae bacterium]
MIRYSSPRHKNYSGGNRKNAAKTAKPVDHLDLSHALQKTYRLLSLRAHSAYEIEKKLRERGFSAAVIKEALEKLHELKYLDDDSFACQWARNLAVNKLCGNRKIITSLKEKGIAAHLIDKALEEVRQEIPEEEAVSLLIKKKITGKNINLQNIKEKKRIFQNLLAKGFPAGLILNKLGKIPEDDFHGEDGQ